MHGRRDAAFARTSSGSNVVTEPLSTLRADRALLDALRDGLREAADPSRAPGMQAYMKSSMPYLGVASPAQKRVFSAAFLAHPLEDFESWRDSVLAIWREATHREQRYAAIALASAPRYRAYRTRAALPLLEELIVTGAWWDYVDATAPLVGEVLEVERAWMSQELRRWSTDGVLWKRRASIICQLRFKERTDVALLEDCIDANLEDRAFFIRKAIGWALRQLARTDPDEVVRYVRSRADRISPLSRREALRHVIE